MLTILPLASLKAAKGAENDLIFLLIAERQSAESLLFGTTAMVSIRCRAVKMRWEHAVPGENKPFAFLCALCGYYNIVLLTPEPYPHLVKPQK